MVLFLYIFRWTQLFNIYSTHPAESRTCLILVDFSLAFIPYKTFFLSPLYPSTVFTVTRWCQDLITKINALTPQIDQFSSHNKIILHYTINWKGKKCYFYNFYSAKDLCSSSFVRTPKFWQLMSRLFNLKKKLSFHNSLNILPCRPALSSTLHSWNLLCCHYIKLETALTDWIIIPIVHNATTSV